MNILDIRTDKYGVRHVIGTKKVRDNYHLRTKEASCDIKELNCVYHMHVDFAKSCIIQGTNTGGINYVFTPRKSTTPKLMLQIYAKRNKNADNYIQDLVKSLDAAILNLEDTIKGKKDITFDEIRTLVSQRNILVKDELSRVPEINLYFKLTGDSVTRLVNVNMSSTLVPANIKAKTL